MVDANLMGVESGYPAPDSSRGGDFVLIMKVIINYIIDTIQAVKHDKPVIVAFDGVDTSGKTTLANMVSEVMKNRSVFKPLRISIDKFHNPEHIRKKRGEFSPEGFFYDSFNYEKIIQNVIRPAKGVTSKILPESYDYRSETYIESCEVNISDRTVILFDGIFLHRDELYEYWDLSIFLEVSFDTVLERALKRDITLFGSEANVRERYVKRYIPGEKLYLKMCHPVERADIVIDNNDFLKPVIVKKWSSAVL